MAFCRSAYPVDYVPIQVARRVGNNSHIRPIKDGIRFLLIIFKIATLYSPLKLFAPFAMAFAAAGLGWYGWTFHEAGSFTHIRMILLSSAVVIFLVGLILEQNHTLT